MKGVIDFFFFIPYSIQKRLEPDSGVAVFVRCFLLLTSNVVSLLIIYFYIADSSLNLPETSRAENRLLGLLLMTPFAIFYWMFRKTYKQKFKYYDSLDPSIREKGFFYVRLYIYGSIGICVICTVGAILWKLAEQKGII